VVIIGGGQAGGEAALRLRAFGFAGDVTLVGEEPQPPYQRPPLSKAYLAGALSAERLLLKPAEAYAAEGVALLTGAKAVWIDRSAKRVRIEGGRELAYDALILATGAQPRRLPVPGSDLPGIYPLRSLADVDAIRAEMVPGAELVVIGAGYIGLEVAASARKLGLEVTVLEAAMRPLARVTSPEIAGFFLDQHTAHGVRFHLGAQAAIIKGNDRVRGVGLADGAEAPADLIVYGVGVLPDTQLAQTAGLTVNDGVVVDRQCRTSDPAIFAVGDCVRRPLVHYGGRMARLESVHNALEGAKIAAAMIAGKPPPAEEAPWFWSDQYDLKLQIAGLFNGYDQLVLRGDPADKAFSVFYFHAGRMIAVDAVNSPADFLGGKQMIQKGVSPRPEQLADAATPIKALLAG
jgi:3-phenylpropionate/trans-cinnamate dioxygenase ferredoxin reductase subunit